MASAFLRLNSNDFVKGAVTAVAAAIVFAVAGFFQQADFNVFSADWGIIFTSALNAAIAGFVGYMSKNLVTDNNGKVFGKI